MTLPFDPFPPGPEFSPYAETRIHLEHTDPGTPADGDDPVKPPPRLRILKPHARGGLGQVFLARDEEMNREVALKEINLSQADCPQSRARFLLEAEVTAGLEHPGIVPVYGLGTYADGRPYYTMRFIQGESLQEAIQRFHAPNQGSLSTGERLLELRDLLGRLITVCGAISYAHARGVVHRDIKPANIMLGPFGETLVVDWGLSKLLGAPAASASHPEKPLQVSVASNSSPTLTGAALGTPPYMSPEQASGNLRAVGPASDVYSLGATLYSILTGHAPFEASVGDHILERVQRGDFPPPRAVNPQVPPALEAITLRATRLVPNDRYPSPHHLAADLERWLANEPVSAYREPLLARLARWANRHRTLVAAGAVLMMTLLVALTVGTLLIWKEQRRTDDQRRRAQKNLEVALDSVDAMLTEVGEKELAGEPRMEQKRRNLLARARACYVDFLAQEQGDPNLKMAVALAHKRLGDVDRLLGRNAEAEDSYLQAITLLEELAARPRPAPSPLAIRIRENRADSYNHLGEVRRAGSKLAEAGEAYRQALTLQEELSRDFPRRRKYKRQQGQSHDNLCILFRQSGKREEALRESDRALAILKPLANRENVTEEDRRQLARAWLNRGTVLHDLKRFAQAVASYGAAIALQESLVVREGDAPEHRHELAASFTNLGMVERQRRRFGAAEAAQERAQDLLRRLVRDHPRVPRYRADLANSGNSLGALQDSAGRNHLLLGTASVIFSVGWTQRLAGCAEIAVARTAEDRARGYWEGARRQFDRLVESHPAVIDYQARRGMVLVNLALLGLRRDDVAGAGKLLDDAACDLNAACRTEPANRFYLQLREFHRRQERAWKQKNGAPAPGKP
jgi:serine/threonine-protein kinase